MKKYCFTLMCNENIVCIFKDNEDTTHSLKLLDDNIIIEIMSDFSNTVYCIHFSNCYCIIKEI